MGQVLHGSATTTHAIRAAIQRSAAPLKELAAQYGLNQKTVAKWRKRAFVHDAPMGPKVVRSTVLTGEEEAAVVAFRKHTLLPLDDCLYALQATIPHLTRSSLHRCLARHGISRLPEVEGGKPRKAFKRYPIGYFHIDIAEVRTEEGTEHREAVAAPRQPLRLLAATPLLRLWLRLGLSRAGLATAFEREMEAGRGFLWLPVLFGIGILIYFVLPREPSVIALVGLAIVLAFSVWRTRRRIAAQRLLAALLAISAGLADMKLRTDLVAAPVLDREITATVTGWVEDREAASITGARLYIRVASIDRLSPDKTPRVVRVTVRSRADEIGVGDAVSVKARLQAASGPVMPGAYDFALDAFYAGIGAVGFSYGAAKPAALGPPPLDIRLMRPLADLRETIRKRIEEALPGEDGRIAAALTMGDQRGISEKIQDDMRASGLGHILSISGLHLALVAGSVFWLLRALLALSSGLALRRPIKKWAAAGALAIAAFYTALSGAEVATVRSFVMLAVMLVAVIADRRALTLRNIALAALAILIVSPESLLSVSFQMSFAATVALVAGYEAISARGAHRANLADGGDRTILRKAREIVTGLFITSILAGLATAPFGIYSFQRVAPLTLIANLAAAPAVGLVIMPMAMASVLLMPFGIEVLPLKLMGYGIDWMVLVAQKTAEWSAGLGGVHAPPAAALLLVVAGFLWLALWRERWRLAGLVPIAVAIPLAVFAVPPDIVVDDGGLTAAVRGEDGRYQIIGAKSDRFAVENWLRADADPRDPRGKDIAAHVTCGQGVCSAKLQGRATIKVVSAQEALVAACQDAAVLIAPLAVKKADCPGITIIDRGVLVAGGSEGLYRDAGSDPQKPRFTVVSAYPAIRRPFMPPQPQPWTPKPSWNPYSRNQDTSTVPPEAP